MGRPPPPPIRAMPERKRFFPLMSSLSGFLNTPLEERNHTHMSNVRQMVKAHVLHNLSPYRCNILGAVERPAWLPHHKKGGEDPQEGRVNRPHPHPDNPVDLTRVGAEMTSSPGVPLTHCGIPRVTKSLQTPYQECLLQSFTILSCHHISAAFERLNNVPLPLDAPYTSGFALSEAPFKQLPGLLLVLLNVDSMSSCPEEHHSRLDWRCCYCN